MLRPDETARAQQYLARTPIHMVVLVLVTLAIAIAPTLIYVSFDGNLDHLLGRARPVTATVENIEADGHCGRSRKTDYRVELSWVLDGEHDRGVYYRCHNAPVVGDNVEVWVGPSGHVSDDSPSTDRAGLTALSVILSGLTLIVGTWAIVASRRGYQQLLLQGQGPLSHGIAVVLQHGGKGRIKLAHSAPQVMGTKRKMRIHMVMVSASGAKPALGETRGIWGEWWLHLTQTTDRKKQIGLLVRGNARCWIYFRRR